MVQPVLSAYGLEYGSINLESFGNGLINSTWKVTVSGEQYILQQVNHEIFKKPLDIANNIKLIGSFIRSRHPDYNFVSPISSSLGEEMIYQKGEGYYRMFPFVKGSHSKDVVETPEQAFEAASQFGRFTRILKDLDIKQLNVTIPFFHDLSLRYEQFLLALQNGNSKRMNEAEPLIKKMTMYSGLVAEYLSIKANPEFKLRVTHHDAKISNVLFDSNGKGICIIDLDTVMPGFFISDVGDMMRTYLSPVSEEEQNFNRIEVRTEFYKAIVKGYFSEMKDELTETEKKYFFYSSTFMVYMQALRFLTDYINNDMYYGEKYPGHNLVRAGNQAVLLEKLIEKESSLADYIGL